MRFIKLKFDNDTMNIDQRYEIDESRSWSAGNFWDQLVYVFKKLTNYSSDHGILLSLPQWSKKFPPVTVVDENDVFQVVNESEYNYDIIYRQIITIYKTKVKINVLLNLYQHRGNKPLNIRSILFKYQTSDVFRKHKHKNNCSMASS